MAKGVPGRLMKAHCKWCGRRLVYAWIPNRGPVMAHQRGDREHCDRLVASGRDLISQTIKREEQRLAFEARKQERKP
jgi:hypothetical protein